MNEQLQTEKNRLNQIEAEKNRVQSKSVHLQNRYEAEKYQWSFKNQSLEAELEELRKQLQKKVEILPEEKHLQVQKYFKSKQLVRQFW